MKVRSVNRSDFSDWLVLWEGYNSFYNRRVPSEVTSETWQRFFDEDEPLYALVAEVDGKIIAIRR